MLSYFTSKLQCKLRIFEVDPASDVCFQDMDNNVQQYFDQINLRIANEKLVSEPVKELISYDWLCSYVEMNL